MELFVAMYNAWHLTDDRSCVVGVWSSEEEAMWSCQVSARENNDGDQVELAWEYGEASGDPRGGTYAIVASRLNTFA